MHNVKHAHLIGQIFLGARAVLNNKQINSLTITTQVQNTRIVHINHHGSDFRGKANN